jgi:ADP-ribose pyrophosphatase YjhB (NUDIX family)
MGEGEGFSHLVGQRTKSGPRNLAQCATKHACDTFKYLNRRIRECALLLTRIAARVLQSYWRLTRGLKLGAEAYVVDAGNTVMLVKNADQSRWSLPCATVRKGETLGEALEGCLKMVHGIEVKSKPKLFWIYTETDSSQCQQTGLFVVKHWERTAPSSFETEAFFRLDRLPPEIEAQTAARIGHILEGRTPPEVC